MGDLESIAKEVRKCMKCRLSETRNKPVPGDGDPKAKIMFIGEAPGRNEDLQGKPFVGRAGEILDELLESVGLKRNEIFITNIVKCRPPENRKPRTDEIKICTPFLDKQISQIKPKIICTLGNYPTGYILERFGKTPESIGKIHGKVFEVNTLENHFKIIPLYHPAAAAYNPNLKPLMIKDFEILK